MANPILRCCALIPGLVLALPLVAFADPATVITHTTGTADVDPGVLSQLGLDGSTNAEELPYELTLRSTFDPVASLPGRGEWVTDHDSQVVIDFRIGGMHYHYEGTAQANAALYTPYGIGGDGYQHELLLPDIHFQHSAFGPAGSFGPGGALGVSPTGAFSEAYFVVRTYPTNPDAPGMWIMGGTAATWSVSAVPEPASYGMMAAGLLLFGWRQRMRHSYPRLSA